jgi:membrane protease YdiL (CAAX protease family)
MTTDEKPRLWIAPAAVISGLCAGIFATLLVDLIGSAFGSGTTNPTPAVSLLSSLAFDLGFVAAALYFTWIRGSRPRPSEFGYAPAGWGLAVGSFVLAAIVYYVVSFGYGTLVHVHGTDKLPSSFDVQHSTAAMLGTAAFICVAAPICEEFFFRGFLFGVLRRMHVRVAGRELGPWLAAVIVAILFGLAHVGSAPIQYIVPLGFLGFVLCLLRWRTGSLYPCMALHSFNNSLAIGVLLNWTVGEIAVLLAASWALIAVITGPLARVGASAPSDAAIAPG